MSNKVPHGRKDGQRKNFMRLRASDVERVYMRGIAKERGMTISNAIREALKDAGLLPPESLTS